MHQVNMNSYFSMNFANSKLSELYCPSQCAILTIVYSCCTTTIT